MITSLGSVTLSCNLPSVLLITQCADEVFSFCINVNGDEIYSTELQSYNSTAKFFDLDQIVSQYMLDHRLSMASLEVVASYNQDEDIENTTVIFSSLKPNYTSDTTFLQDNYLTTRSFFRIPRNASQWVSFYANASESAHRGVVTAVVHFSSGSVRTVTLSHNITESKSNTIYSFPVTHSYLKTQISTLYSSAKFNVLEATFKHGNRFLTFFFTDELPAETLTFYNAFNVQETAFVYGARTLITDLSKKEAVIQRRTSYYSQTTDQRYKIETSSLTVEEALWYNQLLTSPYVHTALPKSSLDQEVLIDDITSDFDLNVGDPIHIKFSYRFSTPEPRQVIIAVNNVYEEPYAVQFGVSVPP